MSCDSQGAIPRLVASVVVVVISVYGEHWLAWLPKVCNCDSPNIIARSTSVVDFASLVSVAYMYMYIIHEL